MKVSKFLLYLLLGCFLVLSIACQTAQEVVYTGTIEKIEHVKDNWSGDYYLVTFDNDVIVKISKARGAIPVKGNVFDIIRLKERVYGITWFQLRVQH